MPSAEQPVCHLLPAGMDRNSPPAPEHRRIDLADPAGVRYWAEQFGVTEQEIREAVEAAGADVDEVRERLARNRSY
jgi:Protein of unknown function (DUF3606)